MFTIATAALVLGCTTVVQPTTCVAGSSGCGGIHDARFCEDVALVAEGADCATSRIVDAKPFCVVSPTACVQTSYVVKDRDCRVVRYRTVRDAAHDECAPGTPMFVSR
ncbi:MAG: hypothetical protein ACLQVI_24755 [Polyangiaceae bacterium]|jgi:hypothetical protein